MAGRAPFRREGMCPLKAYVGNSEAELETQAKARMAQPASIAPAENPPLGGLDVLIQEMTKDECGSALGQKIEWMRSNPLVCLQIDERRNLFHWLSVVVSGRFEELPDTRDFESERLHAHALLQKRAMWWQPALVPTEHRDGLMPVFYRIHIVGITGRRAMPDKFEAAALVTE